MAKYAVGQTALGFNRVLKDGASLSPEQVQAEVLNLLAGIAGAVETMAAFVKPTGTPVPVVEVAPGVQVQGNPGVAVEAGPQGPVVSATRPPVAPPKQAPAPSQKGKGGR